ncbi:TAXI family TRAP transporter solute-binding subunit [Halomonas heilongjiangensis]|uniref:C4-dicarboxylate ABC transporter substrate-binding protein n=1 Tax=Halomonas heilongjiangensis TaxID=1387883 RepID=A0A2N7TLW5_9GAMM|nr:TAXI family TRAP transporter solute-binding subunit [Halomonas heilongjiangensis]PMR69172.1 C4-dicarboxylate ABC transporter substrate-binding protein [Halomonas heilongjiangensis]PXX94198.1 C4-dicarboxylate ABC transporter substrate-binding protein [Halomonas heilongjiangensis]
MRNSTIVMTGIVAGAMLMAGTANADRDDWPRSLTVGTASQGGTYYIYGSGWANLVGDAIGVSFGAEVTGGPVQNATLVQMGEHDFGMVTMGPAYQAWIGESELAPGVEHTDIRAVFPMYQTTLQIISLEGSGINSVADLDGKTVGVGPAGGTSDMYYPQLFDKLGIDVTTRNGGAADQAGQLQDGLLDAFAFAAGIPISAFNQLEAQADVNIFSFSEADMEQVLGDYPELSPATIPASVYTSMEEDLPAISIWNFAITHKDMPESLVYEVTKTVMENNERMVQIHGAASETLPENVEHNTFLPWHPGAVRWFEENGYEIPEDLRG